MTDQEELLGTERQVALVEVLDRALGAGVVITGDITLSLADIDLVYLKLRLLVSSVGTLLGEQSADGARDELMLGSGDFSP